MKLSEIKGERAIEIMADLLEYIGEIVADKKALELFEQEKDKKTSPIETMLNKFSKNLPYLLKTHKKSICSIFATLEDMPYEKYLEEMTIPKIILTIKDLMADEELKQLFTSAKTVSVEK